MLNVHIPQSIGEITRMFDDIPERIITENQIGEEYGIPIPPFVEAPLLVNKPGEFNHYCYIRHNEPYIALEDGASFCTLIAAVDDQGNMLTSHMALMTASPSTVLDERCQNLIASFREQIRQKLTPNFEVLIAAMDFYDDPAEGNIVHDGVMKVFADQRVRQQLTKDWKKTNFIRDRQSSMYSGILTLPPSLSSDQKVHVFVLNESIEVKRLIEMLL